MANTLDRQWRKYPTSGNTRVGDGNPLHSSIPFDLVHGCNNLHKTMPFLGYAAAPTADGTHYAIYNGPSQPTATMFADQVPTVVPDGMVRLCWTLGFYAEGLEGRDATINHVKLYTSPTPYTQPVTADSPPPEIAITDYSFDIDALGGTYGVSTYDTPIAIVAASEDYHLIDMSAGTTGMLPFESHLNAGTSWLNRVNLILTFNVTDDDEVALNVGIRLSDFTFWWEME